MTSFDDLVGNYLHRKHFLQTVNLPTVAPSGRSFLYMKNHKCACTTVIATLMSLLAKEQGITEEISMDTVHAPPKTVLLTGPRGLGDQKVMAAIKDPDVFKFSIIRDPITRTVSAYADKIAANDKQKGKLMRYLGKPADSNITLKQFIALLASDEGARDVDRHWRPQHQEISYGLIPFDYIGTVENIKPAMDHIVGTIFGADAVGQTVDTRRSMGHKTSSKELIETLTDRDFKNLEKAFGPDFEMYETVKANLAKVT
ncbi:sulfotransferase family protein [Pacificibacter maritimus]|uniref:Sulfotransferase family protein n=1 Tax=Pacificibacter maritimus TaxID=762213 RepID=A0A3N4U8U6_9RHOB|nr:sulfotransferase family 2 domain-containing protein [Pacificibacter maritimus]RPE67166.1 sulfotransferase family protein [Pacificibacter maritimus]